jgi:plasmid stabilization system protein ParE
MRAVFSPQAIDDLAEAVVYLHARNPTAAERLCDRVFETIRRLADGEFDGPIQRLRSGEQVRSWPVSPFRVYYTREVDRLLVLRVYHQARRPLTRP